MKLGDAVQASSGSPQFRIKEVFDKEAPVYTYYSQSDLLDDLIGIESSNKENKQIRTYDKVLTLKKDDILFSLVSGTATIVSKEHEGYLYTQNYVKLTLNDDIDPRILVFLINESKDIKKQFATGLQGSQVLKYTIKQLIDIQLPEMPLIEKQKIIGQVYFKQLRLTALTNRVAELQKNKIINQLEEVSKK